MAFFFLFIIFTYIRALLIEICKSQRACAQVEGPAQKCFAELFPIYVTLKNAALNH